MRDIIQALEVFAPAVYQESYDNSGLQIGNPGMEVKGVLVSLDVTEAIFGRGGGKELQYDRCPSPIAVFGIEEDIRKELRGKDSGDGY